jgi:2-methylcitrate dehydratase PrpD
MTVNLDHDGGELLRTAQGKPLASEAAGQQASSAPPVCAVTLELSRRIAAALDRPLPEEVVEKAKHHILDTMASAVSGSRLKPGRMAIKYARSQGGRREATLVGTGTLTSAVNAALANGMMAHADETDDSHAASKTHPGCSIVPAAWAMAEREGRSGRDLLRAVVFGYDVCGRITKAVGVHVQPRSDRSTHTIGGLWGSAAAAGALAGLDDRRARYLISYTAQQTSGVSCWQRDEEHVEKAFDFAGMPARNAVAAATMVACGFTGVADCLSGPHNFFLALARTADPEALIEDLDGRHDVMTTNIKRWSVGSPIIAPMDGVIHLIRAHDLAAADVAAVDVVIPESGLRTVDNRHMPDVNIQHALAVAFVDRGFGFAAAHDYARIKDPEVLAMRRKITVGGNPDWGRGKAHVRIVTGNGTTLAHQVDAVRGTAANPMPRSEVEEKARDLLLPVVGQARTDRFIDGIWHLETLADVRALRPCLQVDARRAGARR